MHTENTYFWCKRKNFKPVCGAAMRVQFTLLSIHLFGVQNTVLYVTL